MKKIILAVFLFAFPLILTSSGFSQYITEDTVQASLPEEMGNTICPVSGEKIDPQTKATYEYQGRIINFCCPVCVEEFKKDPEKYIKKIDEELKSEPKDKSQTANHDMNMMQGAGMSDKGMHEKEGH
ncbi:MAG: YHS domain-containing protein [Candidatus Omnitrophica bacterium]|nr:YHS domain-containing protein [Candidatus Omnitrophota bacterium]MDD5512516.1 YHS domain-containing protein [Candidatus Omnitrophota bacterium]